jgi:glycosyltransferase involved in cell wall biosynthesis
MDEAVTAVVPVYNEEEYIEKTIDALKQIKAINEIIVVNDGSKDNTYEVLKKLQSIKVISYDKNHGKGFAIKQSLPHISNPYVLLVDGDLGSSAVELSKLVEALVPASNQMLVAVYPKPIKKGGFGLVKGLVRKSLRLLTSKSSETALSGQRIMGTEFLKKLELPNTYAIEFKITLEALRRNLEIVEIPVNIRHRETGRNIRGFLHRGKQFINILKVVVRELV